MSIAYACRSSGPLLVGYTGGDVFRHPPPQTTQVLVTYNIGQLELFTMEACALRRDCCLWCFR